MLRLRQIQRTAATMMLMNGAYQTAVAAHLRVFRSTISRLTTYETGPVSVVGNASDCRSTGREFDLPQSHTFVEIDLEVTSTVILLLSPIQEG